ncbi:MAG: flagellar biosynthesis protein FlhF [Pseudomonadales bacterium]
MTTKTIIAADMQHAMSQAKLELGADAIIVNSRRVGDAIEVTVTDDPGIFNLLMAKKDAANDPAPETLDLDITGDAQYADLVSAEDQISQVRSQDEKDDHDKPLDFAAGLVKKFDEMPSILDTFDSADLQPESESQSEAQPLPDLQSKSFAQHSDTPPKVIAQQSIKKAAETVDAKKFAFSSMHDPALKRLIGELKSVGEFWNEFGVYWESHAESFQYPWSKQLRERIDYLHLSTDLRDRLVRQYQEIPEFDNSWQLVLSGLQQKINTSRSDIIRTGGAYALVGPSGAGKTTTIGKLAAEYVLQHGADEVGLITTDIFRIAAYEQLTTMGKILDVDVEVVDAHQGGLDEALDRYSNKSLILIDTAGLRRNDRDLAQQLAQIRKQGERLQTMLVLPANLQYESMQAAMETYETDDYQGCIFTRLDECTSMGAAVSFLVNTGVPAAYLASGHTIPDDLAKASSLMIIEQLLSFACQELDVSKVSSGKLANSFSPASDRQIDLI